MKWVVRKSPHPADPDRPWYAATTLDAAMGLGHPFTCWEEAQEYVCKRLDPVRPHLLTSIRRRVTRK